VLDASMEGMEDQVKLATLGTGHVATTLAVAWSKTYRTGAFDIRVVR
jgi:hypothetical protein